MIDCEEFGGGGVCVCVAGWFLWGFWRGVVMLCTVVMPRVRVVRLGASH